MKMTFLGTGPALGVITHNYHSNVLLHHQKETLLLDAGTDVRFSLHAQGYHLTDIQNIYISHLHFDHAGGLEWLALGSYFDPKYQGKPTLIASKKILDKLWRHSLQAGLSTLAETAATLETYFHVQSIGQENQFIWQNMVFKLIPSQHYFSNRKLMPCFGLFFKHHETSIFFTADTQFNLKKMLPYYEQADIIFHDCETLLIPSSVHANYQDLRTLPLHLKKKIWLYHYNPGTLPDAQQDGFLGFVKPGQMFEF